MAWFKTQYRKIFLAILIVFIIGFGFLLWQAQQPRLLKVAFLNIGQGDAIYIEAPNGNQVLIDGGPGRQVLRALGRVMPWTDHSLDLVIATHPDADHIGGLPAVLERYQVALVMDNGQPSDTSYYQAWAAASALTVKHGANKILAKRGQRIVLDQAKNGFLDILFPLDIPTGKDTNDGSIVARLTFGQSSFLLTGDATLKVEGNLLALDPAGVKAVVLKAGHHGSKTSSGPDFVRAVAPAYAIISAGLHNRYGHPHQSVLDTLTAAGATIFRTDEQGTIVCTSDTLVTNCAPAT